MRCATAPLFSQPARFHSPLALSEPTGHHGTYLARRLPQPCTCGGEAALALHDRVTAAMTRRMFLGGAAAAVLPFIGFQTSQAIAQQPAPP